VEKFFVKYEMWKNSTSKKEREKNPPGLLLANKSFLLNNEKAD
jgi:hypothetical protein